jgi:hypothetical protein
MRLAFLLSPAIPKTNVMSMECQMGMTVGSTSNLQYMMTFILVS